MVIQQLEPLLINHNNADHSANDKNKSSAAKDLPTKQNGVCQRSDKPLSHLKAQRLKALVYFLFVAIAQNFNRPLLKKDKRATCVLFKKELSNM